MLTIGQLADYVGVSTRTIRHYHAIGLLPEPARTASGYRSYSAQDVVDLQRIATLAAAGVPLARVRDLLDADRDELRAAVPEIDRSLRERIAELQRARKELQRLTEVDEPFVRPSVAGLLERVRALGVSEQIIDMEREGWVLTQVLYPELVDRWVAHQNRMWENADYFRLYRITEDAYGWDADDPRVEELAVEIVDVMTSLGPFPSDDWGQDALAYDLVRTYRRDASPGWRRLQDRVEELMLAALAESQGGDDASAASSEGQHQRDQ